MQQAKADPESEAAATVVKKVMKFIRIIEPSAPFSTGEKRRVATSMLADARTYGREYFRLLLYHPCTDSCAAPNIMANCALDDVVGDK